MKSQVLSWFNILMSLVVGSIVWLGCSDTNQFRSGMSALKESIALKVELAADNLEKEDPKDDGRPVIVKLEPGENPNPDLNEDNPHKGFLVFKNTYYKEEGEEHVIKKPLAVLFLIDKTGSMGSYINTVKTNVNTFVDNLIENKFNVKLGYIAYEDDITKESETFTDDVDKFKAEIEDIVADGGNDGPESGFTAIIRATEKFSDPELKAYLKVMILISDNLSHNTPDAPSDYDTERDCSNESTLDVLNAVPVDIQEQVKIYYSVPDQNLSCYREEQKSEDEIDYNYINPRKQMDTLLANSFTSLDSSVDKGGYLGWGFTGTTLIETLPDMINQVAKSQMLCLTDKITAKISDTVSITYESSFEKEYKLFKESKESSLSITSSQIADILKELKDPERFIETQQSCFDLVDLENNDFSKVVTQKSTRIQYEFRK